MKLSTAACITGRRFETEPKMGIEDRQKTTMVIRA